MTSDKNTLYICDKVVLFGIANQAIKEVNITQPYQMFIFTNHEIFFITVIILDNEIFYSTVEGDMVTYNVETEKISTVLSKEEQVIYI